MHGGTSSVLALLLGSSGAAALQIAAARGSVVAPRLRVPHPSMAEQVDATEAEVPEGFVPVAEDGSCPVPEVAYYCNDELGMGT